MRALLVIVLLAGPALADQKPEVADEADVLRVDKLAAQAESLAARAQLALQAYQAEFKRFQEKWRLGPGDSVDPETRVIARAKRAKPTPAPK